MFDVTDRSTAQVSRPHDAPQITFQDGDSGVFDRHIRAGAHSDANIGRRQRWSIIDAVACHRDDPALFLEYPYDFRLSLRENFRFRLIQCESSSNVQGHIAAVARRHHDAYSVTPQTGYGLLCRVLDAIGENKGARPLSVNGNQHVRQSIGRGRPQLGPVVGTSDS